ncbi:hypothetical protein [Helicovermis profundi]|uniref:Uncharacterized protein n=1 Tax=Helicovermis profundi TaxID=3065157 RepID=A0AAU9E4M9_9FIRM|nr:hypothetical protein HLPR_19420 [Clostridia bacterium S502]
MRIFNSSGCLLGLIFTVLLLIIFSSFMKLIFATPLGFVFLAYLIYKFVIKKKILNDNNKDSEFEQSYNSSSNSNSDFDRSEYSDAEDVKSYENLDE